MRGLGWIAPLLGGVALVGVLAMPRVAAADTMDPALARLVTDNNCRVVTSVNGPGKGGVYYNPQSGFASCGLDNTAFAQLMAQYGAAVAPTVMHSARTTGYGGFSLSVEAAFTTIDNGNSSTCTANGTGCNYWQKGTQGPQDATSKNFSSVNASPPGLLQVYALKITKGLPFGFELTGAFGYLAQSSIYTIGADVRWSLFEGFRTGVPAYFPELAVGGGVRTITGTDQFQLTVASADGEVSKPIPIAGTVVLTPWLGYQYLRIFGDSNLIDLTPNTDASNYCGYAGQNSPATPDPTKHNSFNAQPTFDGQPVCKGGSSADFNNTVVFNQARLNRHRILAGLALRVQMVKISGQFMYDVVAPGAANSIDAATLASVYNNQNPYAGVQKQMTLAFDVGAVF